MSGPVFVCRYSATKAILIGMICTFFEALNIPVFWPILVMYFIILFTITMKRQIKVGLCPVCMHQHWGGGGAAILIMLAVFITSVPFIRQQKWFMESGSAVTVTDQVHGRHF